MCTALLVVFATAAQIPLGDARGEKIVRFHFKKEQTCVFVYFSPCSTTLVVSKLVLTVVQIILK